MQATHRLVVVSLAVAFALANAEQPEAQGLMFEQALVAATDSAQVRDTDTKKHGGQRMRCMHPLYMHVHQTKSPSPTACDPVYRRLQVQHWTRSGKRSPSALVDTTLFLDFVNKFASLRGDPVATLATADELELISSKVRSDCNVHVPFDHAV